MVPADEVRIYDDSVDVGDYVVVTDGTVTKTEGLADGCVVVGKGIDHDDDFRSYRWVEVVEPGLDETHRALAQRISRLEAELGELVGRHCPYCGGVADEWCHCGSHADEHCSSDHPFVPMGCFCHREDDEDSLREMVVNLRTLLRVRRSEVAKCLEEMMKALTSITPLFELPAETQVLWDRSLRALGGYP